MNWQRWVQFGIGIHDARDFARIFCVACEAIGDAEIAGCAGIIVIALHVNNVVDRPAVIILAVHGANVLTAFLVEANAMHEADIIVRPTRAFLRQCPFLKAKFSDVRLGPIGGIIEDLFTNFLGPDVHIGHSVHTCAIAQIEQKMRSHQAGNATSASSSMRIGPMLPEDTAAQRHRAAPFLRHLAYDAAANLDIGLNVIESV